MNKIRLLEPDEKLKLAQIINWKDGKIEVILCKKKHESEWQKSEIIYYFTNRLLFLHFLLIILDVVSGYARLKTTTVYSDLFRTENSLINMMF